MTSSPGLRPPAANPRVTALVEAATASAESPGRVRAIARLISLVENNSPSLRAVMSALASHTGRARVIGITGPPGVGKSTTTTELVRALRERGERVAVLAVDPSSPFSGGALLGDRVRMQAHFSDPGVYIRSMATRGHLGGLSAAAPQAMRVFDAAGFDTVLVETVGVGQSEVEICSAADTTLVLTAPGMGDGIQAAKAGILEIGDVFVVNKADRSGAQAVIRDLRTMIALGEYEAGAWKPPIVATTALKGEGISEVLAGVDAHREAEMASGGWQHGRLERAQLEVEALALGTLRREFHADRQGRLADLAARVRDGHLDPYSAADALLDGLESGTS